MDRRTRPGAAAATATTTIPIIVGPGDYRKREGEAADFFGASERKCDGLHAGRVEQELETPVRFSRNWRPRNPRVAPLNPEPSLSRLSGRPGTDGGPTGDDPDRDRGPEPGVHLPRALAAIAASGANAIYFAADPVLAGTSQGRKLVSEWALKQRLPVVSPSPQVAADGGLLSFGTDINVLQQARRHLCRKALKGVKLVDLPVDRCSSVFKLSVPNAPTRQGARRCHPAATAAARGRSDSVIAAAFPH